MTKYILHGGNTSAKHHWNDEFFAEITKSVPDNGKILLVYFSREGDEYARLEKQDNENLLNSAPDKHFQITVADPGDFLKQIWEADAIYIRGGSYDKLKKTIERFSGFTRALSGKIVVGSSAGAYLLSKYFYTRSEDAIREGLGLIPVKVAAHFKGDQTIIDRLNKYKEDLPVIILQDCEYRTVSD